MGLEDMHDQSLKILLVEDNLAEARLLQELLNQSQTVDFKVIHFSRLQAAIAHLRSNTNFDIVLLDLTLPDSVGIHSLDAVLQLNLQIPVVVLTNTNDEELALETVRHGAQDYLIKRHLHPELLSRAIYYAIERKQVTEALHQVKDSLEQQVGLRTAQLRHAKELAQTTLQSIGEAVITTDAQGRVETLNPVAQRLTGWSLAQARNQPLDRVLHVVDEANHESMAGLMHTVLLRQKPMDCTQLMLFNRDRNCKVPVELSISPIRNSTQEVQGLVLVCRDVTPARMLTQRLEWQATHDALTQLINRSEFERRAALALQHSRFEQSSTAVLCYLDLDQFKIVNDTCGHATGDELLRQVAGLLQRYLGEADCLARLGGDEFGLLLRDCSLADGERIAQAIGTHIQAFQFTWGDRIFRIGASIGVVAVNPHFEDVAILLQTADTAMYMAKAQGRNRVQVYHPNDPDFQKHQSELEWVTHITSAIAEDRFRLYAQLIEPIVTSADSHCHYEILLRLQDEYGRLVRPGQFMPAAERFALMPQIDRWVIKTLFAQLDQAVAVNPTTVYAINLSGASFNDDGLLAFLQSQFERYDVAPTNICFEITETIAIANLDKAVNIINHLRQLGCQFSLDDFGTGMSSLTYLKTLPVDYVKIDGQFVRNLTTDPVSRAMVSAIGQICRVMNLKVIAECVENRSIVPQLWELGVSYTQGFAIGKPCPIEWVVGHAQSPPQTTISPQIRAS